MRLALSLAVAAAALAASAQAQTRNPLGTDDWRKVATPGAAERLSELNAAWKEALLEAGLEEPRAVAKLGSVVDPHAARKPHPIGPGAYRCRTIKLGSQSKSGLSVVAYGWFKCRVDLSPGGDLRLWKTTGSQRPDGLIFPSDVAAGPVFVGGLALGSGRAPQHGASADTDVIGRLQTLGPNHWRLVIPRPPAGSDLDILELKR